MLLFEELAAGVQGSVFDYAIVCGFNTWRAAWVSCIWDVPCTASRKVSRGELTQHTYTAPETKIEFLVVLLLQ